MTRSIGNVAAILSVNTTAFSRGLDSASRELSNFGRKIGNDFGASLPDLSSGWDKELLRLNDKATSAGKSLEMPGAAKSLQALRGSLFLVTGESGHFASRAAMAATQVAALTTSAGGLTATLKAAAAGAKAFLVSIGPIGWTILGAAAAYEVASRLISSATKRMEEEQARLAEAYERQRPGLDRLMESRWEAAAALGKLTDAEVRHRKAMLGDKFLDSATSREIIANEDIAAEAKRRAEAEEKRIQKFYSEKDRLDKENAQKIAERAEKQFDQEWDRAIALDRAEEERNQRAQDGLTRQRDLAASLLERLEEKKRTPDTVLGADFSISSASFRGGAPIGNAIGNQSESQTTLKQLEDLNKTQNEALKELRRMVPGLILN